MQPRIRIGVGGWTYEPWRGTFYPAGLAQARELDYASRKLSSIEVNGTYHGSQKLGSFVKWHDQTPDDFVFALKGPRFATNRRVLAEAGQSIERFFASGVMALKDKLGPISWQFMPTKAFDAGDFESFLKLLPDSVEGRPLRHAVEVRHDSFRCPEFVALARQYGVAIVIAGDSRYPQIADLTAPFVYARIMGTSEADKVGYPEAALDLWAERARLWAAGGTPDGLAEVGAQPPTQPPTQLATQPPTQPATQPATQPLGDTGRDVFIYVISGCKVRNPSAAMALIDRVG